MNVPLYFRITEVCRMLGGVSDKFVRAEADRGRFFAPGKDAKPDPRHVVRVGGNDCISLEGILFYLHTWCPWPRAAAAAQVLARERVGAPEDDQFTNPPPNGTHARSAGELLRKLQANQHPSNQ